MLASQVLSCLLPYTDHESLPYAIISNSTRVWKCKIGNSQHLADQVDVYPSRLFLFQYVFDPGIYQGRLNVLPSMCVCVQPRSVGDTDRLTPASFGCFHCPGVSIIKRRRMYAVEDERSRNVRNSSSSYCPYTAWPSKGHTMQLPPATTSAGVGASQGARDLPRRVCCRSRWAVAVDTADPATRLSHARRLLAAGVTSTVTGSLATAATADLGKYA